MITVNGSASIIANGTSLPIQPAGSDVAPIIEVESKFTDLSEFLPPELAAAFKDKLIDELRVEVEGTVTNSLWIFVGTKERLKDDPVWYGPYELNNADYMVHPECDENRYFGFKIVDQQPVDSWKITAIEIFGKVLGGTQK